ncbi:hypothetical protein SLEP1_g27498 [Rubroshorea leprosula]|uniref:Malectin-like domain-containing protein n=1 Tax=Rubroshorea leprosula TaxID=152421 RepID=A0AAV5K385_9ROSI|nr:hypothetical protein SLEP1_g27498 [Rubroshorea leprosula]
MLTLTIFFISLLHLLLPTTTTAPVYNATDIILLDCGSPSNTTSMDGRNWYADPRSIYSSFNDPNSSFSLNASHQEPGVPKVPYLSALIIKSKFTYSFSVSPGPKFLRLYFYPEKYSTFDMTASFFNVTANSYTLLKNFSAHMHLMTNVDVSIKEFIVPVWDNEILNVTFIPSRNSYAFINGIEIVSVPSSLYLRGWETRLVTVDHGRSFPFDNTVTSLETLHRLNVGGSRIVDVDDTGMYRTWSLDADYLVESNWTIPILNKSQRLQFENGTPAYTAPEEVYITSRMMGNDASLNLKSNMTWKFSVDAGFHYLIRLHFCELLAEVTGPDQHVFDIFINNQTVETNIDVFSMSGGIGFPMYRDYRVDNRTQGRDLWLALHPQTGGLVDAFLNGLELFKLNQSDGNLAGPNPDSISSPAPPDSQGPKSKVTSLILPIIGAILGGFALVSLLVSFFVFQRHRKLKDSLSFTSKFFTTKTSSSLPSDICCHFSIAEIKAATQDFDDALLIGMGLAQWAPSCCQNGSLDEIVDPYLAGQIAPVALQKFGEIAENCLHERGNERPTMRDIVRALEYTLQLQETEEENTNDSDAIITDEGSSENTVKSQYISVDS